MEYQRASFHNFISKINSVIHHEKMVNGKSVFENEYPSRQRPSVVRRKSCDSRKMSISSMSADAVGYNSYEESLVLEERLCLIQLIEETLKTAKSKLGTSDILIPRDLISRIAQDVITMSQSEPSGLRGCVMYLNLVGRTMCRKLGRIDCDPCTVATFELHVNLSEDEMKWFSFRKVIPVMEKLFSTKQNPVLLSNSYQIEKRKLYRRSSEF